MNLEQNSSHILWQFKCLNFLHYKIIYLIPKVCQETSPGIQLDFWFRAGTFCRNRDLEIQTLPIMHTLQDKYAFINSQSIQHISGILGKI
jgi:hypothetical protein